MKNRLRELAPAARGSQDAASRNLVFTFQLGIVQKKDFTSLGGFSGMGLEKYANTPPPLASPLLG